MNIVEQVARMIDAEGAYALGYPSTAPGAQPIPFSTRQKYFQAKYEHLAVEIVKLVGSCPQVKADLIEFEKNGWRRLGVPIDDPTFKAVADKTIADKYAALCTDDR